MNMGQFGCKENDSRTSGDDGCFATKQECNAQYSKCWMNMGQFGCKENDSKTSGDDGCFATKQECNAQYAAGNGRKLHGGKNCNPRHPFSCGLLFTCKTMLGNTNHKGKCVPRWTPPFPAFDKCNPKHPKSCGHGKTCQALLGNVNGEGTCVANPAPAPQKCSPNNPTTTPCPRDFTCQALLGNVNGEGTCVANSKCWMNMGQFGCKENDSRTSGDDGCFATKQECNAQYSKCWMNMGQFG